MARRELSEIERAEIAAQTGASDALYNLGIMYSTGRGIAADLISAHKWFNLAAIRGNKAALAYRMEIAAEMSNDEIAEAQRLARKWMFAI